MRKVSFTNPWLYHQLSSSAQNSQRRDQELHTFENAVWSSPNVWRRGQVDSTDSHHFDQLSLHFLHRCRPTMRELIGNRQCPFSITSSKIEHILSILSKSTSEKRVFALAIKNEEQQVSRAHTFPLLLVGWHMVFIVADILVAASVLEIPHAYRCDRRCFTAGRVSVSRGVQRQPNRRLHLRDSVAVSEC